MITDWQVPLSQNDKFHDHRLTSSIITEWQVPLSQNDTFHYHRMTSSIMTLSVVTEHKACNADNMSRETYKSCQVANNRRKWRSSALSIFTDKGKQKKEGTFGGWWPHKIKTTTKYPPKRQPKTVEKTRPKIIKNTIKYNQTKNNKTKPKNRNETTMPPPA